MVNFSLSAGSAGGQCVTNGYKTIGPLGGLLDNEPFFNFQFIVLFAP